MGAASASPKKSFLLITGDVAFHYDIHALWNQENIQNLKIIVINNGGGSIFRIIPGPRTTMELEQFFETEMDADVSKLASHFGWNYLSAHDKESLKASLENLFDPSTKKLFLKCLRQQRRTRRF